MKRKVLCSGGPYNGQKAWLSFPSTAEFTVTLRKDHIWRGLVLETHEHTYTGHYTLVDEKGAPTGVASWRQKSFTERRVR